MAYRLSALVSTYASESFIAGCLTNLLEQTLYTKGQLEIIVVDSGSPEKEGDIVRKFQANNPHIRYLRTENRETLYQAWNRGAKAAQAPILANANTDDRYLPTAREGFVQVLETRPTCGFVYADALLSQDPEETVADCAERPHPAQDFCAPDLLLHHFPGHQIAWRAQIHRQLGGFDAYFKAAGDYDFFLRLAQVKVGHHIRKPLGLRLFHQDAITLKDHTMAKEHHYVLQTYRAPSVTLSLYAMHGIETTNPLSQFACFMDLAFRSLAFFPQWRPGTFDNDLEFTRLCLNWAEGALAEFEGDPKPYLSILETNRLTREAIQKGTASGSGTWFVPKLDLPAPCSGLAASSEALYDRVFREHGPNDATATDALAKRPYLVSSDKTQTVGADRQDARHWVARSIDYSHYTAASLGIAPDTLTARLLTQVEAGKKIVIWGAGPRGQQLLNCLGSDLQKQVCAFVDSDASKHGHSMSGIPIQSLKTVLKQPESQAFLISTGPIHWKSIMQELTQNGYSKSDIILPSWSSALPGQD